MIEKIVAVLARVIIGVISSSGYLGVIALMAIESACIPLPSEIIMPFARYPAKGMMISDGRGMHADSIAINAITPRYPLLETTPIITRASTATIF